MDVILQRLLEAVRAALQHLYGYRLSRVMLYGSHARGEAFDASDIDILVVLKGDVQPAVEIDRMTDLTVDLLARYRKLVAFNPISEEEYERAQDPLVKNVRREGVML